MFYYNIKPNFVFRPSKPDLFDANVELNVTT